MNNNEFETVGCFGVQSLPYLFQFFCLGKQMRNSLIVFILFGVSLAVNANSNNTIRVPLKGLPISLDPQNYTDIYSMVAMKQVHRGLLKFLPNLEIAPDLTENFKVQDDGRRITFTLRKAKFSDGSFITSDHVVRTFHRMFNDRSSFAEDLNYIKNGDDVLHGKKPFSKLGIRKIDVKTVEFELTKPIGIFLSLLATPDASILPLSESLKYDWKLMGGAGAYKLEQSDSNTMTLKLVENVPNTSIPEIVVLKEMDEEQAHKAALKGEIDSLDGYTVPNVLMKKLLDARWKPSVTTMTRQLFLGLNPGKIDMQSRKIIAEALEGEMFDLQSPSYTRGAGIIPYGLPGAFNVPKEVKKEIKPLKKTLDLEFVIVDAEPLIPHLAAQIKSILKKWNINLSIQSISIREYKKASDAKTYQMILRSKFLDYPEGYSILAYFRSSYAENSFFVSNTKVDKMLEKALSEVDVEKRSKLYIEIQKLILNEFTVVPLVFGSNNMGLWSERVLEVPAHPLGIQGLAFESLVLRR